MGRYRDRPDAEPTAFESNLEEIIYHLGLEPDTKKTLENSEVENFEDVCNMCGNQAVWFTSEIRTSSGFHSDEGVINRCWCDDCISTPFIKLWKAWPWTSDEKLATYTPPRSTNNNRDADEPTIQHETATILCHLDLESIATDVIKILAHYRITREQAVCENCDQQADWYHADVYDARRDYDFEAARDNTLLCADCIDSDLVDKWASQFWTPDDELDRDVDA